MSTPLLTEYDPPTNEVVHSASRRQTLVHADALNPPWEVVSQHQFDICFADPPGVDPGTPVDQVEMFLRSWFETLDQLMKKNSALLLCARDRKGAPYLKSVIAAYLAQQAGWKPFRLFVAKWTEGDFNRASYSYYPVYAFRRGDIGTNVDASIRYKDIIRYQRDAPSSSEEWTVQPMSTDLAEDTINLFYRPGMQVLDPFAGSAIVAKACHRIGCHSTSFEYHRGQFETLRDSTWGTLK